MTTAAIQGPGPARTPTPRPNTSSSPEPTGAGSNPPAQTPGAVTGGRGDGGSSSGAGGGRRGARNGAASDPLSDRATAILIRRILCPQQQQVDKGKNISTSVEGLLPPLTSRNDVDLQLYALIAIILREYVQNWYTKITPDEVFVAEIVQLIAHCTRALEQRLRKVDLESLLLDELPDLLDRHITAYRAAHNPFTQPPIETNPHEIYHSLCPLPALSPFPRRGDPESIAEQTENEAAYRQLLSQGVLAILLPTEDLENGCLTALVGQILSELIIGNNVANKLSEPWLILEILLVVTRVVERRKATGQEGRSRSGADREPAVRYRKSFSIQTLFWTVVHWCFLAISFVRVIFTILIASRSLPRRISRGLHDHDDGAPRHMAGLAPTQSAKPSKMEPEPVKTPVLAFRCWSAISNLIEMDVRMPWLCGALSMLQWITMARPGRMAGVDGKIDRLLSHGIHRYLLDPASLPPLLRNVRGALFPNNMPGVSTMTPPLSELELRALRRRCARAIWANLVPSRNVVGRLYFGGVMTATAAAHRQSSSSAATAGASSSSSSGYAVSSLPGHDGISASSSAPKQQHLGQGSISDGGQASSSSSPQRSAPNNGGVGQERQLGTGGASNNGDSSRGEKRKVMGNNNPSPAAPHDTQKAAGDDEEAAYDEQILADIESGILGVFSDAYCNKHLVYGVLELVLVRLMPELAEKGVSELWAGRLPSSTST
ncbi:PXA domain-containing protein [Apodospora peruviana]|uniref:PXA domain-containing protein n=1 Tax=Apodospora peruviana TaxID=516989 RepID=A0AAE0ICU4_9PEZI|nr:PXA domain-containing protein [Apodospora peruviana]